MQKDEATVVMITTNQLTEKRLRGKPRERWFYGISHNLRMLNVEE